MEKNVASYSPAPQRVKNIRSALRVEMPSGSARTTPIRGLRPLESRFLPYPRMTSFARSRWILPALLVMAAHVVSPSIAMAQDESSQEAYSISLERAMNRSLEISPEVGAADAKAAFARARYSLARSFRFLTEFTATSAHAFAPAIDNPNDTPVDRLYLDPDVRNDWDDLTPFNRVEFEAIQPLWTWGELGSTIDAASAGWELEKENRRETEFDVASRTAELYYGMLLADALGRLTREAGDMVEQAKEEIDRLLEEGDAGVDYADLFQVEITEQEFLQRVVEVEESRILARVAMSRQLFLPEGQQVEPESSSLEPIGLEILALEDYQQMALMDRPEMGQANAGLAARISLLEVARSDLYPKLFLGVDGRWSYAADRHRQRNPYVSDPFLSRSVRTGLALRLNLNFAQTRAKIRQAEAEREEARHLGDAARQLILFEVEETWRKVIIAQAAVDAREEALLISKRWLRDEQINFDLDLGDTENLVKAVRDNLTLQAQREEAVHDYNVAVVRLLKRSGMLIRALESGMLVGL